MNALMMLRYKYDRTEVYVEPGVWAQRGLPYPFRNIYHAATQLKNDGWAYEVQDYRLEWVNYENDK